jgi:hypothetical protein
MIVIKPTLAFDQTLRKGPHMDNLDYIKNISIARVCINKPPETTTFNMEGPHTREKEEDLFTKGELPADNKVVAEYEEEPYVQDSIDVQDVPGVPLQEELPADNKVVAK